MFESALYLFMVILGGLGTLGGPILGATIMTILPEALRAFKDYQELMYGLIFVLLLIFMPRGIYGALEGRFAHWREAMAVPFSAVREGKQ
jgi:branched-chain amino acid transport system permease protein